MTLPVGKTDKIVCAHQPAEPVPWAAPPKCLKRPIGECRAEFLLRCNHTNARPPGNQMTRFVKPGAERSHAGAAFQRVLRADKPPDLVEAKLPRCDV